MASREKFEAEWVSQTNQEGDGSKYGYYLREMAWHFWKASRAEIEVEIANHTEFEIEHMISPEKEGYSIGWIDGRNYAAEQVIKIGLKIKGDTK